MKMKKHKTKKRVIKKLKFQDYKICKKNKNDGDGLKEDQKQFIKNNKVILKRQ